MSLGSADDDALVGVVRLPCKSGKSFACAERVCERHRGRGMHMGIERFPAGFDRREGWENRKARRSQDFPLLFDARETDSHLYWMLGYVYPW